MQKSAVLNLTEHKLEFQVRSYECDLQGIVNNANYLHYLEHARHEFLKEKGLNFASMHDEGFDLVITNVKMDYIKSLKSDDKFYVLTELFEESRLRFKFLQSIYKEGESPVLVLSAELIGTCIDRNRQRPVSSERIRAICKCKKLSEN